MNRECPLCGEEFPGTAFTGLADDFWKHFTRCHGKFEEESVKCVCGEIIERDGGDSCFKTSWLIVCNHLRSLTPEEHKRHRLLYELGLRIEEIK